MDLNHPKLILQLREALPEVTKVSFYMCSNCKNVSASEALDEMFHLEWYKNEKTVKCTQEGLKDFFKNRDRQQDKLNRKISMNIIRTVSPKKHYYLELGCGEGSLLKALEKKTDWSLQGVEIEIARAKYAKDKGFNILNKPYSKELFGEGSKTIICLS